MSNPCLYLFVRNPFAFINGFQPAPHLLDEEELILHVLDRTFVRQLLDHLSNLLFYGHGRPAFRLP
jgi:hypothetical protein